ncbi:conserved membrane protein of unknown function [Bradyrhizobium sp. ORS 285]|nr:hypothetical protein [Bradyrhizobium sp. ORS 285]CCD89377.1 conserved membrane hypothetical protein [Bradyrhizobium sp. ORS 285]SMX58630.1 conserved membrane protein of unknown function [Bradyrhizobium sp. ORS 285]
MFLSLWLLASMVLDAVTPPELNFYMIGPIIAPAAIITGFLYWLRIPSRDFVLVSAAIWMVCEMMLEMITPKPLSPLLAVAAVAPLLVAGILLHLQHWRRPNGRAGATDTASVANLPASSNAMPSRRPF